MNWGHKITISFILFAALVITMVIISMQQNVNLVAPNYYEEELAYQDQIDRIKNYEALSLKPSINKKGTQFQLSFPTELAGEVKNGEIHFFRPSDAALDKKIILKLDTNNMQRISTASFRKGLWKVKLRWQSEKKEYYSESSLIL
jgi:nitrogen fixation protein FixH